jgi:N-acetylglucosaminyldiphosphoundecaprenol N-acetyl-beta-D-mannosaminyltransferase
VDSIDILGVRVDDVTYGDALLLLRQYVESALPHYVVTPNPEIVMAARRSPALRDALAGASLAIPDGGGLLLASRLWGAPLREQVRGTDLVLRAAAQGARSGERWFLLGAAPGVAAEAGAYLCEQYPGLILAGAYAGSSRADADADTRRAVQGAGPVDVLLVAFGAPAQELWMARNVARLGIPVAIGVGGVFNYFSQRVPRAPRWMQTAGLEWLFRLLTEPWRWRRQLAIPQFTAFMLWEMARRRLARGSRHARHGDRPVRWANARRARTDR